MENARKPLRIRLSRTPGSATPEFVGGDRSEMVIGRSRECEACLNGERVSRQHARLWRSGEDWHVEDLGSRHGTFLNTIRLEPGEAASVADGDELRIATFTFTVAIDSGAADHEQVDGKAESSAAGHGQLESATDPLKTRATILLRLRDDDTAQRDVGWREFADLYGPVVIGFACSAGLPRHEADDVMQDVLLNFFRAAGSFEYDPAKGRFRGYLKRVTLNAIRDRYRRRRPIAGFDPAVFERDARQTDSMWNGQWTQSLLERALQKAQPRFERETWEAFELYGRRGVPVDEVARQLCMTADAVRHAKHRVAKVVRAIINELRAAEG
jgi:RNA polymerase sigma-70 factor (ECF subfamily)